MHKSSLLTALLLAIGACSAPPDADLVLKNGTIYTVTESAPRVEALAVLDGRIVFAGSNADAAAYETGAAQVIDLVGKTAVPGFIDSHAHLSGIGLREMTLNLEGTASLDDLLEHVAARVTETAEGEWIAGRGWIEAQWDPPEFPTRFDLDKVAPNHPVILRRADGHASVANSKALEMAGITADTKAPAGGEIMRDEAGRITGMLVDRAQGLVRDVVPGETPERLREALRLGAERSARMGWTQVSIAGNSREEVERIRDLYRSGEIGIRIYDSVRGPGEAADWLLAEGPWIPGDGKPDTLPLLTVRGIKVVMDGALGSKGAALLEPYADHSSTGLLMHDEDAVLPMLAEAFTKGIQVQTHAIGDRANRFILDLYEKAFETVDAPALAEPRWRVEHAQILDPADIPRFAQMGVIPSMQASHAITDLHFAHRRLGEKRLAGAYAWRTLIDSGVPVAGGSDAPVEKGDPLVEFYAAAVRKDLKGYSAEHWGSKQRVSRLEALKMLTIWAAEAAFQEQNLGTLERGKWADITVLDRNIMECTDGEIPETSVQMTLVAGDIVYAAEP